MKRLVVLLTALAALLIVMWTATNPVTYAYDVEATARIDVHELEPGDAVAASLSDSLSRSESSPAVASGAPTTLGSIFVAPRSPGFVDDAVRVADDVPGSPNFVVHPSGEVVPVPTGAVGPTPVRSGNGFQYTGGSGGHGLDPRVTDVRIMDSVTTGKYPKPDGYVSYGNAGGQTVNPWTGQTISRSDPWWHWEWTP